MTKRKANSKDVFLLGETRTIEAYSHEDECLRLYLAGGDIVELVFFGVDGEEFVPDGILEKDFFGWREPPSRVEEWPYIMPSDLRPDARETSIPLWCSAQWPTGKHVLTGEDTPGAECLCSVRMRARPLESKVDELLEATETKKKRLARAGRRGGKQGKGKIEDNTELREKALRMADRLLKDGLKQEAAFTTAIEEHGLSIKWTGLRAQYMKRRKT